MNKKVLINNIDETIAFAKDIAKVLKPGDVLCLSGDLGVGKTVIAKGIANFFGVENNVISPTFNILKIYDTKNKTIKTKGIDDDANDDEMVRIKI